MPAAEARPHPRVLVVDDSPTVTEILGYLLSEEGFDVVTAPDGVRAIEEFYRQLPDVVVLDIEMPRMDGYQVCRLLKDDRRVSGVPIIILTSHDLQTDRFRGLSSGADAYLIKNLEDGRLIAKVHELAARSPWLSAGRPQVEAVGEEAILKRLNSMLDRRLFLSMVVNQLQQIGSEVTSLETTIEKLLELFGRVFESVVSGLVVTATSPPCGRFVILKGYDLALASQLKDCLRRFIDGEGLKPEGGLELPVITQTGESSRPYPNRGALEDHLCRLLVSRGEVIGAACIGVTERLKFDQSGMELLGQFLNHTAVILDNARLVQALADSNRELTATLKELSSTQAQLVHSEKMASLGQLTAGLVHEMNNPMNFIAGNLEHIERYSQQLLKLVDGFKRAERELPETELGYIKGDLPELISDMREGIGRAQRIISDLRSFSSGDRGEVAPADLREVVESALNIIRYRLESEEIRVNREYEAIPPVDCNAGQIGQVVLNLLTNAVEALTQSGRAGEIAVALKHRAPWAVIEVRDNGVGIPKEDLDRLFEPFFTTREVGRGMGLGLSVSHGIVQRHAGEITATSVLGEGSAFTVRLPLTPEAGSR